MSSNRRFFFAKLSSLSASLFAGRGLLAQHTHHHPDSPPQPPTPLNTTTDTAGSAPVTTLDVGDLPFTLDNGVKVFRLVAEPVKQLVNPGRVFDLWQTAFTGV